MHTTLHRFRVIYKGHTFTISARSETAIEQAWTVIQAYADTALVPIV